MSTKISVLCMTVVSGLQIHAENALDATHTPRTLHEAFVLVREELEGAGASRHNKGQGTAYRCPIAQPTPLQAAPSPRKPIRIHRGSPQRCADTDAVERAVRDPPPLPIYMQD